MKNARKNTEYVLAVCQLMVECGFESTDSITIARKIDEFDLAKFWNRDPNRKDNNGIKKCVGDILGGSQQFFKYDSELRYILVPITPEMCNKYNGLYDKVTKIVHGLKCTQNVSM